MSWNGRPSCSFIYPPLLLTRQLDLWHCHMGTGPLIRTSLLRAAITFLHLHSHNAGHLSRVHFLILVFIRYMSTCVINAWKRIRVGFSASRVKHTADTVVMVEKGTARLQLCRTADVWSGPAATHRRLGHVHERVYECLEGQRVCERAESLSEGLTCPDTLKIWKVFLIALELASTSRITGHTFYNGGPNIPPRNAHHPLPYVPEL